MHREPPPGHARPLDVCWAIHRQRRSGRWVMDSGPGSSPGPDSATDRRERQALADHGVPPRIESGAGSAPGRRGGRFAASLRALPASTTHCSTHRTNGHDRCSTGIVWTIHRQRRSGRWAVDSGPGSSPGQALRRNDESGGPWRTMESRPGSSPGQACGRMTVSVVAGVRVGSDPQRPQRRRRT